MEERRKILQPAVSLHDKAQKARVKKRLIFSFGEAEVAATFGRPSLLTAGRQDWISGNFNSVDLMNRYPRATLAVLDAAGHQLAFERPEVVKALTQDCLYRVKVD